MFVSQCAFMSLFHQMLDLKLGEIQECPTLFCRSIMEMSVLLKVSSLVSESSDIFVS